MRIWTDGTVNLARSARLLSARRLGLSLDEVGSGLGRRTAFWIDS